MFWSCAFVNIGWVWVFGLGGTEGRSINILEEISGWEWDIPMVWDFEELEDSIVVDLESLTYMFCCGGMTSGSSWSCIECWGEETWVERRVSWCCVVHVCTNYWGCWTHVWVIVVGGEQQSLDLGTWEDSVAAIGVETMGFQYHSSTLVYMVSGSISFKHEWI